LGKVGESNVERQQPVVAVNKSHDSTAGETERAGVIGATPLGNLEAQVDRSNPGEAHTAADDIERGVY
jgi:hypothetical protein